MAEFNDYASPKIETKRFKIYADVSENGTPEWELQGRGVESWTIEENQDIEKTTDVLGFVDMERGTAQPTQSGVNIKLRKGSKLGEMLFDAFFNRDTKRIDSVKILQKFEFIDGKTSANCKARIEDDVMIAINNFTGEAGSYLGFEVDFHYANKITTGEMPKVDGTSITFTPDNAA